MFFVGHTEVHQSGVTINFQIPSLDLFIVEVFTSLYPNSVLCDITKTDLQNCMFQHKRCEKHSKQKQDGRFLHVFACMGPLRNHPQRFC